VTDDPLEEPDLTVGEVMQKLSKMNPAMPIKVCDMGGYSSRIVRVEEENGEAYIVTWMSF
jgi:hypothetical protein